MGTCCILNIHIIHSTRFNQQGNEHIPVRQSKHAQTIQLVLFSESTHTHTILCPKKYRFDTISIQITTSPLQKEQHFSKQLSNLWNDQVLALHTTSRIEPEIAPSLVATARALEREMKKDTVGYLRLLLTNQIQSELESRPSVEELESKGVLCSPSSLPSQIDNDVAPSLASRAKSIEKEFKKDSVPILLLSSC